MYTYRTCLAFVALLVSSTCALADTQDVAEPFVGVRVSHATATEPRLVDMWVVEIDPHAPGISFLVTPSNGNLIGDTKPETTRAFVSRVGAQIGINGSFFSMAAKNAPSKGQYNVQGLSVSKGDAYSPFAAGFTDAINISKDNVPTIIQGIDKSPKRTAQLTSAKDPKDKPLEVNIGLDHKPEVRLYNALSGKHRLVKNGKNVANQDPAIHPRTGIGITPEGKLLLFTVDGREKDRSLGLKLSEMADKMIHFGAHDAINLDGGGSTTLVMDDPTTKANDPRVLNLPCDPFPNSKETGQIHGKERATGNNLAIFARPIRKQTPARKN